MWQLTILIVITCIPATISEREIKGPRPLPWWSWPDRLMFTHLINMTAELIFDATSKLRHADKIREMHSHSITFELGSIAAGIQERFQRMLKIYKKHANIPDFEKETYRVPELINAFHVMQGDYNEIRLEKAIFYDIVRKHESTQPTSRIKNLKRFTTSPRGMTTTTST